MGKLLIITITRYHRDAKRVAEELARMGYRVKVETINKPFTSLIDDSDICGILNKIRGRYEYIIVPYNSRISSAACKGSTIVKLRHLYMLPELASTTGLDDAHTMIEYTILNRIIHRIAEKGKKAWCIGGICTPHRPPPILVASDVYASQDPQTTLDTARSRLSAGADLIVLGTGDSDRRTYLNTIELLVEDGVTVAADAPLKHDLLIDALDTGAHIGMSLTRDTLKQVPRRLREDKAFVIIPSKLLSPGYRVRELLKAEQEANTMGYTKLILDPVAQPLVNPGFLPSLIAAKHLSRKAESPLMLGINNVVELLDADSTGSLAVISGLIAEAGVSIVLTSEESWKTRGSTLEARIAVEMASLALHLKTTMKDLGLSLLLSKQKRAHPEGEQSL